MSYALSILVQLGAEGADKTLVGQLMNSDGDLIGVAINTGFVELQGGDYLFTTDYPDDFRGVATFFDTEDGSYQASIAINPQEYEYTDAKSSYILAQITALVSRLAGMTVVTVNVPTMAAGRIDLIRGDDYTLANGKQLDFVPDDPTAWPVMLGQEIVLGVGDDKGVEFEGVGTITSIDPTVATVEVRGIDTNDVGRGHYRFTLRSLNGNVETLAEGILNLHNAWGGYR